MRKKNQLLWLLPLVIMGMAQCSQETINTYHDTEYYRGVVTSKEEEKIYSNAIIEDDFDSSSVLVVLDKKTGDINKTHKKSFFGSFEMEYIKDLTEITGDIDSKEYLNKELFRQILLIKLPTNSKSNVLDVIKKLEKVEGVLYAGPDYYLYPAASPNDPKFTSGYQWGLSDSYYGIQAPAAWDITTGAKGILVGILDDGIATHPDLDANVLSGWNFEANNSDTNDTTGHGTAVAGVVGAVSNNNTGIAGVCWDVSLVPLVTGNNDHFLVDRVASAISFAISANIDILNFSKGNFDPRADLQVIHTAVQNYRGLFVCAAGNENINIDSNTFYYGFSRLNNVIIVGAINNSGNRWVNSNYGNSTVHLFAPGDFIYLLNNSGGYYYDSGTSFAAPHVAGAAALIKSVYPFLTASGIKNVILSTVNTNGGVSGYCSSGGRLDVQAALNSLDSVVGYFDIKINNPNWVGASGVIGRFYLFNNGNWTFVERGFRFNNSLTLPGNYNISGFLQANPVSAAIINKLNGRILNTMFEVMIPAYDPRFGQHYTGITVGFTLNGSTVTFSHINNTIRAIGDCVFYNKIFKITNKQGTL